MRDEDLTLDTLQLVEELMNDTLHGELQSRLFRRQVGAPVAHLLKDETSVQREAATSQSLRHRVLLGPGEVTTAATQPLLDEADAQFTAECLDLDKVRPVREEHVQRVEKIVLVGKRREYHVDVGRELTRQPRQIVGAMR